MKRTFAWEQVKEAYWEEGNDLLEQVYEGPWEQEGKQQWQEVIFKATDDGKFYAFYATRSGSPFTDWYYDQFEYRTSDEEELTEVSKVKQITYSWEPV